MGKSRAHVNVIGNVSVRSTQCGKEKDGWHLVKWGRGQRLALDRKAPPAFLGWGKEKLGARTGQVLDLEPEMQELLLGGLGFLCRVGDGIICREEGRFEERGGSGRCFESSGVVGGGGQRAETSQWPWAAMGAHRALASLGGLFCLPHVLPGRRWGMGSFRACCRLGRSSEFGVLV